MRTTTTKKVFQITKTEILYDNQHFYSHLLLPKGEQIRYFYFYGGNRPFRVPQRKRINTLAYRRYYSIDKMKKINHHRVEMYENIEDNNI